ncbi:hypothetical protein [Methylobacterium sp. A54F]
MSIVAFPNTPRVGPTTPPGLEVVVAPLGDMMVAWVRTDQGYRILESSPDWRHALADGRAYAARFGIPLRFQGVALDTGAGPQSRGRGGTIYLDASERDGGSWDVVHLSESGDSAATVGNAFGFDDAVTEAQRIAGDLGASFQGACTPLSGPDVG